MNKLLIFAVILSISILFSYSIAYGFIGDKLKNYSEIQIPSWVKHSAGWWSEDRISDKDYLKSIQYLIDQGIIKIK